MIIKYIKTVKIFISLHRRDSNTIYKIVRKINVSIYLMIKNCYSYNMHLLYESPNQLNYGGTTV